MDCHSPAMNPAVSGNPIKYKFKHPGGFGIYNTVNRILTYVIASLIAVFALSADAAATRATLLLSASTAKPGDTITAAVRLEMSPGWHTYWKNGGDSGGPSKIDWQLPVGVTAGEIQWPTPEKYTVEGLGTYIYHNEAVLLVPLKLGNDLKPGPLELKAEVSWLECEQLCVPGDAPVSAKLEIGVELKSSTDVALIESARKKLPQVGALQVTARWQAVISNDTRALVILWPGATNAVEAEFFPDAAENYQVQSSTERLADGSGLLKLVGKSAGDWPTRISGVLVFKLAGNSEAHIVDALTESSPQMAAVSSTGATATRSSNFAGLILNLALALLGGMILNLMPCVLPILSLKILAVVNQQGKSAAVGRKHSLVYAAGVLVSFWVIAALVVFGKLATWGEQFQDARFIVVVTTVMTLVALNLFGVFEFILPGRAVGSAAELAARKGASGAFFNGMLAVVLGASCVAPVLAGAIGWAVNQTPVVIFLTFSFIGVGLALPYVALTFFPSLQRLLPRPGAWMEKFKVAMGFPMLATAAWLLSLVTDHYGRDGVLWVGLFLVLLAAAAWIFGEFIQRGTRGRGLAMVFALACLGLGYGFGLERKLDWRHPNYAALQSATTPNADGIAWEPWSVEAVAKARAAGRPVFVDFTANWCLTCQANKASSIEIDSVRQKLKEINAIALLGDYTRKDLAIRDELKRFERAGVPLVLVYPKDASAPAEILPTLLTPGIVLDALEKAAK